MKFELKKKENNLGILVDTLVKIDDSGQEEDWCNVLDLDALFDACVKQWKNNWDLNKVITAIRGCDFD